MSGGRAGGAGNVERGLARFGLVAATVLLLLLVLVVDLWLSGGAAPDDAQLRMRAVGEDGVRVEGGEIAVRLHRSTLFHHVPDQPEFDINAAGLRGELPDPSKARPRVLIIGGSTAFGLRVGTDETFTALLQAAHPGVEFLNGGVEGYQSDHEFVAYALDGVELEPDLIVTFDGWNDLYAAYYKTIRFGNTEDGSFSAILETKLADLRAIQTSPWSAFAQMLRTLAARSTLLSLLAGSSAAEPDFVRPPFGARKVGPFVQRYADNLEKLRDFAADRGANLLVVLQPEAGQLLAPAQLEGFIEEPKDLLSGDRYWPLFVSAYFAFRKQALEALEARDIDAFDITAQIPRFVEEGMFLDPVHLSPRGHVEVAELLWPKIRDRLRGRGLRARQPKGTEPSGGSPQVEVAPTQREVPSE